MRLKNHYRNLIARSIADLETMTEAEVVLVVRRQSGNYRDLDYLVGLAASLVLLAFLLFSPWVFNAGSFFVPLALAFFVFAKLSDRWGFFRALSSRTRKRQQVSDAARVSYVDKNMVQTRSRAGLLIYISLREHQVQILGDSGILAVLKPERIEHFRSLFIQTTFGVRKAQRIAECIETLGLELHRILPAHSVTNELPNSADLADQTEETDLD